MPRQDGYPAQSDMTERHQSPGLTQPDARPQPSERIPKRRNRTGCLTCRRRRKRCDGARDVCGHCSRLNLVCHWQSPRDLGAGLSSPAANAMHQRQQSSHVPSVPIAPAPVLFLQRDACEPARRALDRKLALRYYVQTFNAMLTTNLENNGFLSVLLPMAIEDKTLLDMLVAWSSSHLSLCDDSYRIDALEHRSTALQSFTSLLSTHESPETSLACCLVFCSMSAILGDTAGWQNHLVGAANIIRHAAHLPSFDEGLRRLSATYEGRWLLRNFAYHDVLMSVTSDREPLIPGRYWLSQPDAEMDSYVGLASEPVALMSDISSLNGEILRASETIYHHDDDSETTASTFSSSVDSEPPPDWTDHFSCRARNIEAELQNWSCPESPDASIVSLAEAYRSAALIHLYRVVRRQMPAVDPNIENKVASQAAAIVYHLGQMPLKCLPECTSLFPLFIAGGETRSKREMQFIRERLQHITAYRHFQNAASALSVLEELWLQHTSITGLMTSQPLDWLDILERRKWSLALS